MDIQIIAISVAGTNAIPIAGVMARLSHMDKADLIKLAEQGKPIDLTLRYPGLSAGSHTEKQVTLKATLEDVGGGKKLIAFQDVWFSYEKGGMFFSDVSYN